MDRQTAEKAKALYQFALTQRSSIIESMYDCVFVHFIRLDINMLEAKNFISVCWWLRN